uniref:Uncharacterized protein n=1 Tax=Ciona savignyi TaxID=51511 RepID=H2YEU6_CIOSA
MSMNAYFGALPILKALDLGAEVVVTGRCVDSALVLAPLMHSFGWKVDDYDRLAAGNWDNIGFPVAECYSDGHFVLTKPDNTGGMVTCATAAEQLVYEIGDPSAYILPDVVCDFRNVEMQQQSKDLCATYLDGFRCTAVFSVGGKRAIAKAHRTADSILKRVRRMFKFLGFSDFKRVHLQAVGSESLYGAHARTYGKDGPRETVIPVLKLFSFLHPKSVVPATVSGCGPDLVVEHETPSGTSAPSEVEVQEVDVETGDFSYTLEELAYTRSGDKGNNANIGVIARKPAYIPVKRYELPGVNGFNFVLTNCLGGGGVTSLRTDPQGKAFG